MLSEAQILQQAIAFQKVGKLEQAESLYRDVLNSNPKQADALHLLGLIASNRGDLETAIQLIRQAVDSSPTSPVYVGNLGVIYRQAGRINEAIQTYRRAIELDAQNADVYFNLGKSLKLKELLTEAEAAFRTAISIQPSYTSAWLSLMSIFANRYDLEQAREVGEAACKACGPVCDLYLSLGAVYRRSNLNDEAIACYEQALQLQPKNVDALARLASFCFMGYRFAEGTEYLQRAINVEPESVHVLNAIGLRSKMEGDLDAAVNSYRKSIQKYPHFTTAFANLAGVLRKQGSFTESLDNVRMSVKQDSNNVETMAVEGSVLVSLGRLEEAEVCFRRAIEMRHGYRDAHDNLLMCLQYQKNTTPETLYAEHLEWNKCYAEKHFEIRSFQHDPAGGRLRLGFVSGDLGAHPVGYFTVKLFESIDREKFSTFIYSDRVGNDDFSTRMEQSVDRWFNCASLSDEKLRAKIIDDKIDILFDLAGHTAQNRLLVFARRAAPIQVSWAGYVGTTGLKQMDYLIADRFHVPEGTDHLYSEKVLRMPDGYVTYRAPDGLPDVTPPPCIEKKEFTFGAMCNPTKVNDRVLAAWSEILNRVPNSRLLLSYSGWMDIGNQNRVKDAFRGTGCTAQVDFHHKSGPIELMSLYGEVDVCLDTFPYSGGLTTCEALWMGVPTVTFPGDWFAGRHSTSHMMNLGLNEFVADNVQGYIEKAVLVAANREYLIVLRQKLRNLTAQSPLCDGERFAKDFSELMQSVWKNWMNADSAIP